MMRPTLMLSAAAMLMLSVSTMAPAQEAQTSQPSEPAAAIEHDAAQCRHSAHDGANPQDSDKLDHACIAMDEITSEITSSLEGASGRDVEAPLTESIPPADDQASAQATIQGEVDAPEADQPDRLAQMMPPVGDEPIMPSLQGEPAPAGDEPAAQGEIQGEVEIQGELNVRAGEQAAPSPVINSQQ
jgi:hypothetical protein